MLPVNEFGALMNRRRRRQRVQDRQNTDLAGSLSNISDGDPTSQHNEPTSTSSEPSPQPEPALTHRRHLAYTWACYVLSCFFRGFSKSAVVLLIAAIITMFFSMSLAPFLPEIFNDSPFDNYNDIIIAGDLTSDIDNVRVVCGCSPTAHPPPSSLLSDAAMDDEFCRPTIQQENEHPKTQSEANQKERARTKKKTRFHLSHVSKGFEGLKARLDNNTHTQRALSLIAQQYALQQQAVVKKKKMMVYQGKEEPVLLRQGLEIREDTLRRLSRQVFTALKTHQAHVYDLTDYHLPKIDGSTDDSRVKVCLVVPHE